MNLSGSTKRGVGVFLRVVIFEIYVRTLQFSLETAPIGCVFFQLKGVILFGESLLSHLIQEPSSNVVPGQ